MGSVVLVRHLDASDTLNKSVNVDINHVASGSESVAIGESKYASLNKFAINVSSSHELVEDSFMGSVVDRVLYRVTLDNISTKVMVDGRHKAGFEEKSDYLDNELVHNDLVEESLDSVLNDVCSSLTGDVGSDQAVYY